MTPEPRIAYDSPALRVIETPKGPVVELPDGRDSLGAQRWIRAVLSPDRSGAAIPVYDGWKDIARACGYADWTTAARAANRAVNPLPVVRGPRGRVWIFRASLEAWVASQSFTLVASESATKDRRRKANRAKGGNAERG